MARDDRIKYIYNIVDIETGEKLKNINNKNYKTVETLKEYQDYGKCIITTRVVKFIGKQLELF